MTIAISIIVGLCLLVLHAGLGGKHLAFALPAYGLLAVAALLSLFLLRKPRLAPSNLAVGSAFLFFGYIALRAVFSPVEYYAAGELLLALAALAVYLLYAVLLTEPRYRLFFVLALMILLVFHAWAGILQFSTEQGFNLWNVHDLGKFGGRISGLYFNPDNAAIFFCAVIFYALSLICWSRWTSAAKVPLAAVAALAVLLLLLTASRGGMLCFVTGLFVFILLSLQVYQRYYLFRRTTYFAALAVAGLVALGTVVYVFSTDSYRQTAQPIAQTQTANDSPAPMRWRSDFWDAGWRQVQEENRLLTGTGAGSHFWLGRTYRSPRVQTTPVHVHNDYLELLAEYGILGGVLLLALIGTHAARGWQAYHRLGFDRLQRSGRPASDSLAMIIGSATFLCALIPAEFFDFHLQLPANLLIAAFALAVLANPGSQERDKRSRSIRPLNTAWRVAIPLVMIWPLWQAVRRAPAEFLAFQGTQAYLSDQNYLRAAELLERSTQLNDQNPHALAILGETRRQLALKAQSPAISNFYLQSAVPPLQKALARDPYQDTARWVLAMIYDAYGQHDQARALLEEYLEIDPRGVMGWTHLAIHLTAMGELEEARQALRQVENLAPYDPARRVAEEIERLQRLDTSRQQQQQQLNILDPAETTRLAPTPTPPPAPDTPAQPPDTTDPPQDNPFDVQFD